MVTTVANIHRQLLVRFIAVWIVISLVVGGIAYYLEWESTDEVVLDLAKEEALTIFSGVDEQARYEDPAAIRAFYKARLREIIRRGHFLVAEVYDVRGEKQAEIVAHDGGAVEKWLDNHPHLHYLEGKDLYRRFTLEGNQFIQVFVPLFAADRKPMGHLEGVYRVSPATMRRLERQPLLTTVELFFAVLATMLILYPIVLKMNKDLRDLGATLADANIGMLETLGAAISKRDSDTSEHNYRVTIYAVRIAETMGILPAGIRGLIKGAFLHDVGKIAISDAILLKPGKLTDDEFTTMKTHVAHGVEITREYPWLADAVEVVGGHHEKMDGSGYPHGLSGEKISLNARIFAIADVFDALMSERPYKKPFPFDKTIAILEEGRDSHFDGRILDAFLSIAESLEKEVVHKDSQTLKKMLRQFTERYF